MPRYTQADITADAVLTNISVFFMQEARMAHNTVFATVPVEEETGKYYSFKRDDLFRIDSQRRKPGAVAAQKVFDIEKLTFSCEQWALDTKLPDEDRATKDSPVADDEAQVMVLSQDLLLRREKEWLSAFFVAGVWGLDRTGTTDFVKWDNANSDLLGDVRKWISDIKKESGRRPNIAVMTQDVWDIVVNDEDVVDRIKYTSGEPPSEALVARLMGVPEIVVIDATENTAADGATFSGAFLSTKKFGLFYRAPTPALRTPSAGYVFSWTDFDNVAADILPSGAPAIRSWYEEDVESTMFRGKAYYDMGVVAKSCGLLADAVIA